MMDKFHSPNSIVVLVIVKSHVHTETTVDTKEFNEYVFRKDGQDDDMVQLIFCLKEVKVYVDFTSQQKHF